LYIWHISYSIPTALWPCSIWNTTQEMGKSLSSLINSALWLKALICTVQPENTF